MLWHYSHQHLASVYVIVKRFRPWNCLQYTLSPLELACRRGEGRGSEHSQRYTGVDMGSITSSDSCWPSILRPSSCRSSATSGCCQ